jgi:hypothetical protein
MKRNIKPFSVEIKKPRVQSQRYQLPPRRLFELTSVEPARTFQTEEPQATTELAPAPRILQSIVEPVWGSAEPVDPVGREPSPEQDNQEQMELDLTAASSEDPAEAHLAVPMVAEAMSQADMAAAGADTAPIHNVHPAPGESSKKERKPRKRSPGVVEHVMQPEPNLQLERMLEPVILEVSMPPSPDAIQRRRTKRLAEAAQLPRSERWKRRLHPASR